MHIFCHSLNLPYKEVKDSNPYIYPIGKEQKRKSYRLRWLRPLGITIVKQINKSSIQHMKNQREREFAMMFSTRRFALYI